MSLDFVNQDETDPKFKELKDTFKEEIGKRFTCEDYEPIVKYVFDFVFGGKSTKENAISEMKDIFHERAEEIITLLWTLAQNIYLKGNENDLIEEIYKDHKKKFASQVVNPNENSGDSKYPHNERHAVDTRRRDNRQNRYDRYDNRYRPRDYDYNRKYSDERRRRDDNVRTMQVGDKRVVLKRKDRSRSRSNSGEKIERSRERNEIEDERYEEDAHYARNYYPQDRYYMERGFYPVRRFMRGGRFGRYLKPPRFIDPRRPIIRKRVPLNPTKEENPEQPPVETNEDHTKEIENANMNINQVTTNTLPSLEANQPSEKSAEAKKKIRCKKWPMCKNEGCEFAHPKETCPYFPKCMFGDKCLFIHPNIACKFGFCCTRIGCAYSHPVGYNPGMGMMPAMGMGWGGPGKFKNFKLENKNKGQVKVPDQNEQAQLPIENPEQTNN